MLNLFRTASLIIQFSFEFLPTFLYNISFQQCFTFSCVHIFFKSEQKLLFYLLAILHDISFDSFHIVSLYRIYVLQCTCEIIAINRTSKLEESTYTTVFYYCFSFLYFVCSWLQKLAQHKRECSKLDKTAQSCTKT